MKYTYKITGVSNSGKPAIYFNCEHCRQGDYALTGAMYSAELEQNVRKDIEAAAAEFVNRLNISDTTLFKKKSTWNKIAKTLCYCDPKVVDIERHKATQRAKRILQIGLEEL